MKTGRNEKCPCGSGQKYKRCCLGTGAVFTPEVVEALDIDEITQEDVFKAFKTFTEKMDKNEMIETAHRMSTEVQTKKLEALTHIQVYQKLRDLHGEIVEDMHTFLENGKFHDAVEKNMALKTDNKLDNAYISIIESKFKLEDENETQALYDLMIYKHAPNINCIIEHYLSTNRYRNREKISFMESMLNSKLGLFSIEKIDKEQGYVYLEDVFTGEEHQIVDIALSNSGDQTTRAILLYRRIITHNGISFGTAFHKMFEKSESFIKRFINAEKKNHVVEEELLRFAKIRTQLGEKKSRVRTIINEV
jgi:hypothetical protein